MVGWYLGWLVSWLVGWYLGWLVGQHVHITDVPLMPGGEPEWLCWLCSNRSFPPPRTSTSGGTTDEHQGVLAAPIHQFWSTPRPPTSRPLHPLHLPTQPENHTSEHFSRPGVNSNSSVNWVILGVGGRIPATSLHICCGRTDVTLGTF